MDDAAVPTTRAERGTRDDRSVGVRRMPRWYVTLFTSDAMERFGFYGLQAILVLYASAPAERGGLGLAMADAAALFGAWIGLMFMLSLAGGWVGDRWLGNRTALLAGCAVNVVGYLLLSIPAGWTAAAALPMLAIGGAVYKPNHQAMINMMFGGSRSREAGISLMYVASQVSALLAPLIAGYLGERVSWHLAFLAIALVLLATTVQLRVTSAQFHGVGATAIRPLDAPERRTLIRRLALLCPAIVVVLAGLAIAGLLSAVVAIGLIGLLSVVTPIICYVRLRADPALESDDRRRLTFFLFVYLGSALFWMIVAHAASLLNLFARDHVDLEVLGFVMPASWLQAATPLFILLLAPVIASALPRWGGRHNVGTKFSVGLLLVGAGFLVMSVATSLVSADGTKISPWWMVLVYLTHACGEVIIAAVTISAAADVLPAGFLGRTLGMLWLFAGLGGGIGSGVVRLSTVMPEPLYYSLLGSAAILCGVAFWLGRRALTRGLS
ncbi:oligopeptide:H+ symporter [Amycolatopsis coloradensis]|uniref:Oligopeptide:H+ symporter n=1 Tax=Amycolatopsis coloradensis TaxID=76021 RepID=A0ACD5BJZ8_9PSEU